MASRSAFGTAAIRPGTRFLAALAGCVAGATAAIGLTPIVAVGPGLMVVGAILYGRSTRAGTGFMAFGAALATAWVCPMGFWMVIEGWHRLPDANAALMTALGLASAVLVACTDVWLVFDGRRGSVGLTGRPVPPTGSVSGT